MLVFEEFLKCVIKILKRNHLLYLLEARNTETY